MRGLDIRRVALPLTYEGFKLESGYRIDLMVDEVVIFEVKAAEAQSRLFEAQVLTYLKLSGRRIGFVMNFNVELFKNGLRRVVL